MGWSFRKSTSLSKWIRLNLSKSGVGVSFGPKGANISIGPKGTYLNTSIPGTGIRYREKISGGSKNKHSIQDVPHISFKENKECEEDIDRDIPEMKVKDIDPLFWDAAYYVVQNPIAGTGRIKYQFDIDFVRAAAIVEQLESNGIITPFHNGRKVLVTNAVVDEMKRRYEQEINQ